MINIAFTGGGTAGHIYPGLAVAAEFKKLLSNSLQEKNIQFCNTLNDISQAKQQTLLNTKNNEFNLFWVGSSSGMDRSIVEKAGIEFYSIPCGKFRRYFSFRTIIDFFKVTAGFFAARKIFKKLKPCLLFSKGGFVSVPPCAAAASLGIPVFTHESDFSPGLATKINARYAARTKGKIFTAYEETAHFFPEKIRSFTELSGNPVRDAFRNADAKMGRQFLHVKDDERILLVLGGSQGAHEINNLIGKTLCEINKWYTVVHQTGPNTKWDLQSSDKYKPYPFIGDELPGIMAAAEIILGRSGAGIWEWAVSGKPMVLIPLRGSGTRGDQVENAEYLKKEGAACVLKADFPSGKKTNAAEINPQTLISAVGSLANSPDERLKMAAASKKIGEKNGALYISKILYNRVMRQSTEVVE